MIGTKGRDLEVGTEAEAMKKFCLQACSSWFTQFAFLQGLEPPAHAWHLPQCAGPPIPFMKKKKCPSDLHKSQSDGGIFFS